MNSLKYSGDSLKRISSVIIIICILGVLVFVYMNVQSYNLNDGFRLEAHRGYSDMYPENTIVSFEAAGEHSEFDAIETDVQMTSDGVLVLMHDSKLDRTTNATGKIMDYTYDQLMEFRIDGGNNVDSFPNEKIPKLDDFLNICIKYKKMPYIEMKRTLPKEGVEKLIGVLVESGYTKKCVLTTFSLQHVEWVRDLTDEFEIQFMQSEESYDLVEVLDVCKKYDNVKYRPNAYMINHELVNICKKNGIQLEAYGLDVGDKVTFNKLKEFGVAGVTCNSYKGLE